MVGVGVAISTMVMSRPIDAKKIAVGLSTHTEPDVDASLEAIRVGGVVCLREDGHQMKIILDNLVCLMLPS